ncbi:MAG TPA: toll/interleukin-1 receptor domain-containing protein [Xanthomonadaceae bacterium]|nr:toll/interleukin-1 receptor domain-containing protein [Xanthomonadaceae bacterium]
MACYQLVLLGLYEDYKDELVGQLTLQLDELGVGDAALAIVDEDNEAAIDARLPVVAVFFGGAGEASRPHPALRRLLEDSIQVIPVVSDVHCVSDQIPEELQHVNALARGTLGVVRLATLVLESFRLLRRERRLFISYKRSDSQLVANQLYDALDAQGFDVFIDVRSVPPGVDFQAELWHRLADSDVVVLLDTPGFRESRWTTEELARANATNIQILHVLWPGQAREDETSFSDFVDLTTSDFDLEDTGATLSSNTVGAIAQRVERLRARAIAARHRYLVDSFCDSVRDVGMQASLQPERWIAVTDSAGRELAVVPTVGVPTSERIHRVFQDISGHGRHFEAMWLLYDDRGVLGYWLEHLSWLDSYLPVRTVTVASCDALVSGGAV